MPGIECGALRHVHRPVCSTHVAATYGRRTIYPIYYIPPIQISKGGVMRYEVRRVVALAALCLFGLATSAAAQTKSTTTETKRFEIISVDGNTLVVRGAEGTKEITVPADFKLTVNGTPTAVSDLKPGMKGTATITT